MSNSNLKFKHHQIFEINGFSKINFNGEFNEIELTERLANEWIPYNDCSKCGKREFCKYSIENSQGKLDTESNQCEYAVNSLKNFILNTSKVVVNSDDIIKQEYLDSLYFFTKYVLKSEQLNSILVNNEQFKHYGWNAKAYSSMIIPIRDILNELSAKLKGIPGLHQKTSILLLEGESEIAFINSTRGSGNVFRFDHFILDCYHGGGNKKEKRIKMLLDKYKEIGYSIYFQADRDGKENTTGYESFFQYVKSGFLEKENIFQFKYDFETAIPKKILYDILIKFNELDNVEFEEFDKKTNEGSINKSLCHEFKIDTETKSLKKRIASEVGRAFLFINPLNSEQLIKSELGQFIDFLESIK
jgi:hypothetical protein